MSDQQRYAGAIAFAAQAHIHQFRWGGEPFITHPFEVAQSLKEHGESAQVVAVLHDVLEDTDCHLSRGGWIVQSDWSDAFSVTTEEESALIALTHDDDEDYMNYIQRVIEVGGLALLVKIADIRHNLRIMKIGSETHQRHRIALNMLVQAHDA